MSYCNHEHYAQFDATPVAAVAALAAAEPGTPPVCDMYAAQRRNRLLDDLASVERLHRGGLTLSIQRTAGPSPAHRRRHRTLERCTGQHILND